MQFSTPGVPKRQIPSPTILKCTQVHLRVQQVHLRVRQVRLGIDFGFLVDFLSNIRSWNSLSRTHSIFVEASIGF